ncbi:MAG TPA: hypothetical protein VLJ68_08950 [Chitinophagaceae bacterium]|nr:hypothetical protein [Chitinophagaceae bacterium]
MTSEIISMIANLALALSFIVGLIFGIAQVRTAERDRRERYTVDVLREFQTREFVGLMQFVNTHELPPTRTGFLALSAEDQTKYFQYAQEMESLGILVAEKLISLDLVDKTLGSFVTTTWEKYKAGFSDMREKTPDPYLGEYFQWLAEQIEKRMRETPRKPFYQAS